MRRRFVLGLLLACSGPTANDPTPVAPKFVAFRETFFIVDRLETPVTPPYSVGSSPAEVRMTTSDPGVVGVDSQGNLIGHRNGLATVRAANGATLRVEVHAVETLSISPPKLELQSGSRQTVRVVGGQELVRGDLLRWQTTDPNVAAGFGNVIQAGLRTGTATLTADVGAARASLEVTVRDSLGPRFSLVPSSASIPIGAVYQVRVEGAANARVTWSSSKPAVLESLRDGLFHARAAGQAQACATVGASTSCATVHVASASTRR